MNGKMERKQTYPIDDVLVHVIGNVNVRDKKKLYMSLDGDQVKIRSDRLLTFKRKGIKCVRCGIEGKFFAKEKFIGDQSGHWHLNLYAVDNKGQEVLMTKDHIMPKSKGGADALYNYQPMCTCCNGEKADTVPKFVRRRKTLADVEAEVSKLSSVMGGKDSIISRLTNDNKTLLKDLHEKRKEAYRLRAENATFKKRIEQLVKILMEPTFDPEEMGNGQ
jgi:hypothetical protein